MRSALKRLLNGFGFRIERVSAEERLLRRGYDPRRPPPMQDLDHLTISNPRLQELTAAYGSSLSPVGARSLWSLAAEFTNDDLRYFRGDNLYLWQYTRSPEFNRFRNFIYGRYVQDSDACGLLQILQEDGAFGCLTWNYAGMPAISRDLLDSVNEINFLHRHIGVLSGRAGRVLDVGAGYGRLAHRLLEASTAVEHVWCIDAVPCSTFLCEYYLKHRRLTTRSTVISMVDMREALSPGCIDIAINVHSFSEMPRQAVEGWLRWLTFLRVPALFVVPNERDRVLSREKDGRRVDCEDILVEAGYHRAVTELAIQDEATMELLGINDYFLLYRRA